MSRQGDIAPAPWRQGRRYPDNIYDARGRYIARASGQATAAERAAIAARIVAAVNAYEGERE